MTSSAASRHLVGLASDQALMAHVVRTALFSRGLDVELVAWPGRGAPRPLDRTLEVGLLLSDLDEAPRLREAQSIVQRRLAPWVVLTSASPGPIWGALLSSGAAAVLPSSTTLDEVVMTLVEVATGRWYDDPRQRQQLVARWEAEAAARAERLERMVTLSSRELDILHQLYAGLGPSEIAGLAGVSVLTVRSHVKAVLRKLGVSSQLTAVAAYGEWLETQPARLSVSNSRGGTRAPPDSPAR